VKTEFICYTCYEDVTYQVKKNLLALNSKGHMICAKCLEATIVNFIDIQTVVDLNHKLKGSKA